MQLLISAMLQSKFTFYQKVYSHICLEINIKWICIKYSNLFTLLNKKEESRRRRREISFAITIFFSNRHDRWQFFLQNISLNPEIYVQYNNGFVWILIEVCVCVCGICWAFHFYLEDTYTHALLNFMRNSA